MSSPDPAGAYRSVVSDILDARRPAVPYPAGALVLSIVNRRQPRGSRPTWPRRTGPDSSGIFRDPD